MASGWYVYAILARETPLPPELSGFGGAAVSTVPWRALAAATSPLPSGALRPTAENVWRHETIVEALRQQGPALPVRFGTVLADAEAVAHALAERYDVLVADLARLGDKVELGLSVLWEPPRLQGEEQSPGPVPAFQGTFAELRRAHPDLRFLLSGPWPPLHLRHRAGGGERSALSSRLHGAGPPQPTDRPNGGTSRTPDWHPTNGEVRT